MNSKSPLRTYLSGGMEYAKGEGADWRYEMESWVNANLGHEAFNPNRESDRFMAAVLPNGQFRELKGENPEKYTSIVRKMIDQDCQEIAVRSDYVICYWDSSAQRGAGTTGEVTMARYTGKPVYLVTKMDIQEIPGWVLGCATRLFSSFDDLKTFLLQNYRRED